MNRQTYQIRRLIILITASVLLAAATLPLLLRAQSGAGLPWGNVSSGYGISRGSGYIVSGTSGEVDAGQPLSGNDFNVTGGFWSGVDEPPEWIPPTPPPSTPTPPSPTPTPSPRNNQLYLPSVLDQ